MPSAALSISAAAVGHPASGKGPAIACWQLLVAADARTGALTASAVRLNHHELRNRNVAATVYALPDLTQSCAAAAIHLLLAGPGRASKMLKKGTIDRRLVKDIDVLRFINRSGLLYLKYRHQSSSANDGRTVVSSQNLPQDNGMFRTQIRMLTGMQKLSTRLSVLL